MAFVRKLKPEPLVDIISRFRFERSHKSLGRRWNELSDDERSHVRAQWQQVVTMLGGEDEMRALCELVTRTTKGSR